MFLGAWSEPVTGREFKPAGKGSSPLARRLTIFAFVLLGVSQAALAIIHHFDDDSKFPRQAFSTFVETEHYSIASDSSSVAAVQCWGAFAERCHASLERAFAPLPGRDFDVAVCTSDTKY